MLKKAYPFLPLSQIHSLWGGYSRRMGPSSVPFCGLQEQHFLPPAFTSGSGDCAQAPHRALVAPALGAKDRNTPFLLLLPGSIAEALN